MFHKWALIRLVCYFTSYIYRVCCNCLSRLSLQLRVVFSESLISFGLIVSLAAGTETMRIHDAGNSPINIGSVNAASFYEINTKLAQVAKV